MSLDTSTPEVSTDSSLCIEQRQAENKQVRDGEIVDSDLMRSVIAHQSHLHSIIKHSLFFPITLSNHQAKHIVKTTLKSSINKKQEEDEEEAFRGPPQSLPTANPTEEQQGFGKTT